MAPTALSASISTSTPVSASTPASSPSSSSAATPTHAITTKDAPKAANDENGEPTDPQPLTPHWPQPSHPHHLRVHTSPLAFHTSSHSLLALPPGALFCALTSPPITPAPHPTYATVQSGPGEHVNLNSDLVYINHSCRPSLEFDMRERVIRVAREGPGLEVGGELTFFYPSTEWVMAKGFACRCGEEGCLGWVGGAKSVGASALREGGWWVNGFIWEMFEQEEEEALKGNGEVHVGEAPTANGEECKEEGTPTENGEMGEAATTGKVHPHPHFPNGGTVSFREDTNGEPGGYGNGNRRTTPSSRELAGEMGGDTVAAATKQRVGASSRELGGEMGGDTDAAGNGDAEFIVDDANNADGAAWEVNGATSAVGTDGSIGENGAGHHDQHEEGINGEGGEGLNLNGRAN